MEWYSEKVMTDYNIINKIVGNMLKEKYPNLAYFEIGKRSFNELFNPERELHNLANIDITMCIDFTVSTDSNVGVWAIRYLNNIFKMVITDSDVIPKGMSIYTGDFNLNKTEYCKGIIPYTVD